ncbi:MAG: Smr/MutS family protein [Treponema sp.]|nr:Smr/MutS family protein [Candidatus Treponema equi]
MNKDRFLQGQIAEEFDFYKIREIISHFAQSEEGRDAVLARESTTDKETIDLLKNMGRQWNIYLNSDNPQALFAWPPVKEIFPALGIEGGCLNQEQIFALGLFSTYTEKTRSAINGAKDDIKIPDLAKVIFDAPFLGQAADEIFRILDISTGQVKDLPVLREIRSRIASLKREIDNAIRKYTSDSSLNQALQSNVPAFRADRELLAVRADRKNSIKGIVHEVSATGQTVYIEPDEIVKSNNALVEEEFRLQSEINKIFRELTESLGKYKEDFIKAQEQMLLLDSTYAAARWQNSINGIFAEDCDVDYEPPLISKARHPLLGEKAVPVTITFMQGKRVLIITGPNTGGKTVTLKTVALFALLNQAGFPLPAEEGTRLPMFSSIFADIGDEQSIAESLSTFSSRMKNVALALNNTDERSLVLLDELGSGTDPLEGSAIAMATLDLLLERGSFVIVTTHHGVLKNYGYTNPSCINASVEFSTETMRPTYNLLMGIPGESHALDIALHSGLPREAVEKAQNYISTEQADVSSLIKGLTSKHEELDDLLRQQRIKGAELQNKEHKIHSREIKVIERDIELKEIENKQSFSFLRETRSQLENLVRILREGEITKEKTQGVKKFISDLEDSIDEQKVQLEQKRKELEEEISKLKAEEEKIAENGMRITKAKEHKTAKGKKTKQRLSNAEALKNASVDERQVDFAKHQKDPKKPAVTKLVYTEGMEVLCGAEKRKGTLVRKVKDGIWQVQIGFMKIEVPQRQMVPAEKIEMPYSRADYFVETTASENDEAPKFELRLLGMRCEEAMRALEHQLDLCAIKNFRNFSIVHGKGNGILQQAVHDYLSHYPGVKDYRFARPEEGGSGKTYVELN